MKVYFAGSIRGGRQDAGLYKRIIAYIQRSHVVLTEHVGDLSKSKTEGLPNREVAIYEQDTAWLREADVVIAECTTPSLGVGYELAYAEAHGIPAHIFYDKHRTNLSAMLAGDGYFQIHPYRDEAEIYPLLDAILSELDDAERKYIEDSKIVIPESAPERAPKLFRNCSQETEIEIPE